jgi:hypothetical protein
MMNDDDIALKLMRLYKELRGAEDPAVRQSVCDAIDDLVAQVKRSPQIGPQPYHRPAASAQPSKADDD